MVVCCCLWSLLLLLVVVLFVVFVVFVIALVAMEFVASSLIASAAHLGGLVAGLVAGVVVVGLYRFALGRAAIGS